MVDDDEVVRTFVTNVFTKSGWTVHAYENGKEFLEQVRQQEPALVFLDLQMPVMNGFQVLEFMREHSLDIPIIILSALTQKETIVKAQGYGVNSYLIKPVSPDQVRKKSIEALSVSLYQYAAVEVAAERAPTQRRWRLAAGCRRTQAAAGNRRRHRCRSDPRATGRPCAIHSGGGSVLEPRRRQATARRACYAAPV